MEYRKMKLTKEDLISDDEVDYVKNLAGELSDWLANKDVRFGSSNIIFLVEYCQLWCRAEPLDFFTDSELMTSYRGAIHKRNKAFGEFVDWNNSSFGIVVADNAKQAIDKFLEIRS